MKAIRSMMSAMIQPAKFFKTDGDEFKLIMQSYTVILGTATIVYFATTLTNLSNIRLSAAAISSQLGPSPFGSMDQALPWNRLIFFLIWIIAPFIAGIMRFLVLRFLGTENLTLSSTQTISIIGMVPFVIAGGLLGVYGNFFPPKILPAMASKWQSIPAVTMLLIAIVTECIVTVRCFRVRYLQKPGPALLVWSAPYLFGMCTCFFPVILMVAFRVSG